MKRKLALKINEKLSECGNWVIKIFSYLAVIIGAILIVWGMTLAPWGLLISVVGVLSILFKPIFSDILEYRKECEKEQKRIWEFEANISRDFLPVIFDDYMLRYKYDAELCMIDNTAMDLSGNSGKQICFEQEPNNPYDKNAVVVLMDGKKIGYVYRGQIQDMLNDWFHKGFEVGAHLNRIDVNENKVTFKIGFYKPILGAESKVFPLVKVTRTKDEFDCSRADNLASCRVGEVLEIEYGEVVSGSMGEIGELNAKAQEFCEDAVCCAAKIETIDYNKATIRIFKFTH